jgi:hypothetical protein
MKKVEIIERHEGLSGWYATVDAVRYLQHRASLRRGGGRWPLDMVDYGRWVRLGGERYFPECQVDS